MTRALPATVGDTYGRLTALTCVDSTRTLFRCQCGNEVVLQNSKVRSGNNRSCGCLKRDLIRDLSWALGRKRHDISPGEVFGRLTAVAPATTTTTNFLCSCGTEKVVRNLLVRTGRVQSCGCLQVDRCGHPLSSKGVNAYRKVPEYKVWAGMRYRCNNPNNPGWAYYGAKGIKVCSEWDDFAVFFADMGPRPSPNHSLDRIDGSKGYCKENCRWADTYQQNQNRSNVKTLTVWGETKPLPAWAKQHGIQPQLLRRRLRKGMTVEDALLTPVGGLK